MSFILLVQSKEMAKEDALPFIPLGMLMEGLWGVAAFGPYETQSQASEALRTFHQEKTYAGRDSEYNLSVVRMRSLSEELDNPAGALWYGDSPDE